MNSIVKDNLVSIVGEDFVITNISQKTSYLYDEIEHIMRPKADENSIVVKPKDTDEISKIMKYANKIKMPVVVRGGGTGLCGGCIPTKESIILSTERLKKIVEIDEDNMVAVLEAGVTLFELLEELDKHEGVGFPVHPGDEGAQMGGMAATNAGGARAVKHGVMRKHIQGMEVVLPSGEIMELGGKLIKNNAGYNLMQLIIGSEGTLAIVTKIILKIYPKDKYSATIIAPFKHFNDASNAVMEILKSGVTPLAVEYQDKHLFVETAKMLGTEWQAKQGNADLMIIISEKTEDLLYATCKQINDICQKNNSYETLFAGKKSEQDELLLIRSQHYEYIKDIIGHSFDTAVPVASIPAYLNELKELAKEYNTFTNITAHIADGNIHSDIVLVDGKMPPYAEELKDKIFKTCFKYNGTITGEHGVGKLRIDDLKLQKSEVELNLMKSIKKVFDPNNILNPGTVLDM
ncbi:glycolate oxidase [Sedimentibacter acidaminivorans]|uniref:Glycolate oxidase n=1 Tax=Sedimentibacter acidaminivorans TaxID=913099 RepID=A0ABS4GH86_9FIRM|nr:FAD-binding oxidoreductase [Sedimentibacter acidaminivorans]MBP1926972.1 glycolate oxidase [Sedimentibacter acidaminivorans]